MSNEVLDRIAALIAKGNDSGATEAEAASAMALAMKLMKKNMIDHAQVDKHMRVSNNIYGDMDIRTIKFNRKQLPEPVMYGLALALAEYVSAKIYTVRGGDFGTGLKVYSTEADFEIFQYLFNLCWTAADNEFKTYAKEEVPAYEHARKYRKPFMMGMYARLGERLREMKATMAEEVKVETGNALVVLKDQLVTDSYAQYLRDAKIKLKKNYRNNTVTNRDAFYTGRAKADYVKLNKAIEA